MKNYFWVCLLLLIISVCAEAQVPQWAEGAVWYQILPERFRNTVTSDDPLKESVIGKNDHDWQIQPWAADWYKPQVWEKNDDESFAQRVASRRYGGDLYGVYEKLLYLKNLGVSVIYLMPIFESPSVLKYDAVTFHHVDNNFGLGRDEDVKKIQAEKEDPKTWTATKGDEMFFELIKAVHKLDMKIVLEGVFNYCNREFWAFKDLTEKQEASIYKDWFEVEQWDDPLTPDTLEFNYKVWQGNRDWPVFKTDENGLVEPVKKYFFAATKRWMDPDGDGDPADGIDGWCVRYGEQLGRTVMNEWIDSVKAVNPNALVVEDVPALQTADGAGKKFDVSLNNAFMPVVYDFFIREQKRLSVSEFDRRLKELRDQHADSVDYSEINPVDDMEHCRIASAIKNPEYVQFGQADGDLKRPYDPDKPTADEYQIQKLIAFFQLTYPGSPLILYGDESGMWGCGNPDILKPMLWEEFVYEDETYSYVYPQDKNVSANVFNPDVFSVYQKLDQLRLKNPALRKGSFESLVVDDQKNIYGFRRKYEKNEVVVFLNNSSEKQTVEFLPDWPEGTKVKNPLTRKKYRFKGKALSLELGKKWGAILVKSK